MQLIQSDSRVSRPPLMIGGSSGPIPSQARPDPQDPVGLGGWPTSPLRRKQERNPMTTRCKFRCNSVTLKEDGSKDFQFSPAYADRSPENKLFWKYTPTGSLVFNTVNLSVEFVPGREYYLDITEAPAAEAPKA